MPSTATSRSDNSSTAAIDASLVGASSVSRRITIGVVSPALNSVWSATHASRLGTPAG